MANLDSILKSKDITLLTKVHIAKAMAFPVVMYRCESWTIKKAEHWIIYVFELVLEKTLERPLDSKEIKLVNPKGNQPWIFSGRTDAEAEAPILWPPDTKNLLTGKDPNSGKDWRQEEKKETGWDGWMAYITNSMDMSLSKLRINKGQGSLTCCSPWGCGVRQDKAIEQQQCTTDWIADIVDWEE